MTTFENSYSKSIISNEIREAILKKVFPNPTDIKVISEPSLQEKGIDFSFTHKGRTCFVEEKRRDNTFVDDIYLEYQSIDSRGQPRAGWVYRLINADFLLYYWKPANQAVVLEAKKLGAVFADNFHIWIHKHKRIYSTTYCNDLNYTYSGLAIPFSVLEDKGVKFRRVFLDNLPPKP